MLQPKVLDLNTVVGGAEKMLRRLIGEDIEVVIELAPELGPVKSDPGRFEQIILNLAVNGRDAMPRLLITWACICTGGRAGESEESVSPCAET